MEQAYKSFATFALSLMAGLAFVVLLGVDAGLGQATQGRPNIIFVLTDDQMPGTEKEMPALQSNLVREGTKFANMTSTFPLCCPGRATLLRGQYVHNTQIYGNSPPAGGWGKFEARSLQRSTFATWLDDEGYQTGLFGKLMNNYREEGKGSIPPGWDRWYAWNGVDEGWTSVNDQGKQKPLDRQEADSLVADEALGFLDTRLRGPSPPTSTSGPCTSPTPTPTSTTRSSRGRTCPEPRPSTRKMCTTSPTTSAGCPGFRGRRCPNSTRTTATGCAR
jgi:hypothetical protein